jgi:phenylacetate-CoA ligase
MSPQSSTRTKRILRAEQDSTRRSATGLRGLQTPIQPEAADVLLGRQLATVLDRSEFYQRILGATARGRTWKAADLVHLPFTTREQLQADQAEYGPFGSYLGVDLTQVSRVHRTSGSSGRALIIALSAADVENSVECGARCFRTAGAGPGDLIVHCLNFCMWSGGVTDHHALERSGAAVIPYGVGNSSNLINVIMELRPTGIHCTPSYLAKLEQRLKEEFDVPPSALGLKLGLFGGEPGLQDPQFRSRIEETWGFRAVDANYGLAEVLSMFASECPMKGGLHFVAGDVLCPELKDPAGDGVVPWEQGANGELVITHLQRECQPLIRYRTSDIVELVSLEPCGCGLHTPRWRVVGRVDDMVVIRGINVYIESIAKLVNHESPRLTGEYRVLVNRSAPVTDFVVKVETRSGPQLDGLAAELEDRFAHELGVRPSVTLLPEGSLPRTDGKTNRLERVL